MKRIFVLTLISVLFIGSKALAQSEYKVGVGLRAGWPTGVSAKYFFSDSWAVEAVGTGRYRGIGLTLLLEKHKPLGDDFNWYFGGGFHGAFYSGQYYNGPHKFLGTGWGRRPGICFFKYSYFHQCRHKTGN
jgi:hypothetical protein